MVAHYRPRLTAQRGGVPGVHTWRIFHRECEYNASGGRLVVTVCGYQQGNF